MQHGREEHNTVEFSAVQLSPVQYVYVFPCPLNEDYG